MKTLYVALAVFATVYTVVSSSAFIRPPVKNAAPTIVSELHPGSPAPRGVYCDRVNDVDETQKYCSYGRDINVIVRSGVVSRVYLFLQKSQNISIGQVINQLGDPAMAQYGQTIVIMYWPDLKYTIGVAVKQKFSPASRIIFAGWGNLVNSKEYVVWRGFINP